MTQAESAARSLLTLLPFLREQLMKPTEQVVRSRFSSLQFFTVNILAHHRRPMMMSELADQVRISKQHLTAIVDRLIEQGSVERSRDPGDRRVVRVELSKAGLAVLTQVRTEARRAMAEQLKALPPAELAELEHCLVRVREILGKMNPSSPAAEGGA